MESSVGGSIHSLPLQRKEQQVGGYTLGCGAAVGWSSVDGGCEGSTGDGNDAGADDEVVGVLNISASCRRALSWTCPTLAKGVIGCGF